MVVSAARVMEIWLGLWLCRWLCWLCWWLWRSWLPVRVRCEVMARDCRVADVEFAGVEGILDDRGAAGECVVDDGALTMSLACECTVVDGRVSWD